MKEVNLQLVRTNLRRYTFQNNRMRAWVENNCSGRTLNLFAGKTLLNVSEIRNDVDLTMPAEFHKDALDFVREWEGKKFKTILLDPPYSYRKSMEMYEGNYSSRFKRIADNIPRILQTNGKVISFGYHSSFMGKNRDFYLHTLCVFAHSGSQHCTIAIVELRK